MSRIGVIVVPVDFSQSSIEALRQAASWAEQFGSDLHLLHVLPDPRTQMWSIEAIDIDFATVRQDWVEKAEAMLNNLVSTLPLPSDRVKTRVQVGRPGEQIVAYAKEREAGLIMMASGEHGRVARFVLGSVADYVVRAAACPVVVIPVHGHHVSVTAPSLPAYAA
jgi:nucleotide-binding universal stress UspA family protein